MREALAKLNGQRCAWTATFVRYGSKPGFDGRPPVPTILLRDVKDVLGHVVTDHLWFTETVEMKACPLETSVEVAFVARVSPYEKGSGETDYRLSHPTSFRLKSAPVIPDEWKPDDPDAMPKEQLGLF